MVIGTTHILNCTREDKMTSSVNENWTLIPLSTLFL